MVSVLTTLIRSLIKFNITWINQFYFFRTNKFRFWNNLPKQIIQNMQCMCSIVLNVVCHNTNSHKNTQICNCHSYSKRVCRQVHTITEFIQVKQWTLQEFKTTCVPFKNHFHFSHIITLLTILYNHTHIR